MVTRTLPHFMFDAYIVLSPCTQSRREYCHLGERNEDSTEEIWAWEGVVVCLVIGGRTGMSDRCLTSPKSETQCFTCQPFCCIKLGICQYFVLFNNAVICRDYTASLMTGMSTEHWWNVTVWGKPKYSRKILKLSILCIFLIACFLNINNINTK